MRYRIKYSKQGLMKFIGHLDMMRSFQKLLRRTGFDVTFSEGYSPHMIMSYAFPLGVGMTSDSEYVDVDFNREYPSVELVRKLNDAAPEGIHFLDARVVQPGKGNKGMTLVARADYTLTFRPGHEWPAGWKEDFRRFTGKSEIIAVKKGKKTEKEINIAPLIYRAEADPQPHFVTGITDTGEPEITDTAGESRVPEDMRLRTGDVFLSLSAGSTANIRPELVMETFARQYGYEKGYESRQTDPFRFMINRDEVFASIGEEGSCRFIPLIGLGKTVSSEGDTADTL